jgi:hypothetical protein
MRRTARRFTPTGFALLNRPLARRWLIVYLLERDAEAVLFPPYDAARPAHPIGLHDQREFVGNS